MKYRRDGNERNGKGCGGEINGTDSKSVVGKKEEENRSKPERERESE